MNAMKYVGKFILLQGKMVKVVSVMPRADGWARVRVTDGPSKSPRLESLTEAKLDAARSAYLQSLAQP